MKKTLILLFALALAGARVGYCAAESAKPVELPKAAPAPDPVAAVAKERDDLKVQLAQAQFVQINLSDQQAQITLERNDALKRLIQANARVDDLQKQLDAEKSKTAELQKKIDDAKPAEKPKA